MQGGPLTLTPFEFRLLRKLAAQPGHVFSRAQLIDALYEDHRIVSDRTVDSHIRNLRRKRVGMGIDPMDRFTASATASNGSRTVERSRLRAASLIDRQRSPMMAPVNGDSRCVKRIFR